MGTSSGPDGAAARSAPLIGAVAVLALALLLLAGAAGGPWQWDAPEETTPPEPTMEPTATDGFPTDLPSAPLLPEDVPTPWELPDLSWLLIVLAVLVGAVLTLLIVRLVLTLRREQREPPDARDVAALGAEDVVDAPVIAEGIAAAQEELDQDRPPRDAIVRAWLALETAAGQAGVPRRPAQTPTEFAAVVLTRTPADAEAVDRLRGLYLTSRFSEAEITVAAADQARAALLSISRSWTQVQIS